MVFPCTCRPVGRLLPAKSAGHPITPTKDRKEGSMNRRPVYIYRPPEGRNFLVRGINPKDLAGIRGMWSRRDRGLWVHNKRLPDVLAALEIAGRVPEVIAGDPR